MNAQVLKALAEDEPELFKAAALITLVALLLIRAG